MIVLSCPYSNRFFIFKIFENSNFFQSNFQENSAPQLSNIGLKGVIVNVQLETLQHRNEYFYVNSVHCVATTKIQPRNRAREIPVTNSQNFGDIFNVLPHSWVIQNQEGHFFSGIWESPLVFSMRKIPRESLGIMNDKYGNNYYYLGFPNVSQNSPVEVVLNSPFSYISSGSVNLHPSANSSTVVSSSDTPPIHVPMHTAHPIFTYKRSEGIPKQRIVPVATKILSNGLVLNVLVDEAFCM